ncbi:MAG: hypothetical protein ABR874_12200 [Candidatus Sulfotelmatobacter sp.]|jgi:hypothetical protein
MSHLRTLLNLLAVLAIAQAAVKGLEIVLDSRQQLVFQQLIERLALKLIDLDPIRHYLRLRETKVQLRWLAAVVALTWTIICLITLQSQHYDLHKWWSSGTNLWRVNHFPSMSLVLYLIFCLVLWWFGRSRDTFTVLLKVGLFTMALAAIGFVGGMFDVYLLDKLQFTFISATFFYTAGLIVVLYVTQAAVWLFRHILWRIATDTRGAWSAFLFVVAALLALAAALVPK